MNIYHEYYGFQVTEFVEQGFDVFVLDKVTREIFCINNIAYSTAIEMLTDKTGRYFFWSTEEVGDGREVEA